MKLAPFWAKSKKTKQLAALDAKRKALVFDPPPIWFWPKKKKENGEKSKIESENNFKEVELFLDPTNRALGKFKVRVQVLSEPKPEEWLMWIKDIYIYKEHNYPYLRIIVLFCNYYNPY